LKPLSSHSHFGENYHISIWICD